MNLFFESPSWIFSCILIVALSVGGSLSILLLVRKKISVDNLKKSHDVVGFTFSIIGVLYSVILGFIVVNVHDRYNNVAATIQTEALTVANLYRDAGIFQAKDRNAIRTNLRAYVDHVIREEWSTRQQEKIETQTQDIMEKIWEGYYNIDLTNEKMVMWYTESISKLNNFMDARISRQFNSREHLGPMMWSLLIIGALITICFMFFFGLDSLASQMIMTALLAGYLSFMLHLIFSLDHVFQGPEGIKPIAFEQLQPLFDRWDQDSIN